MFGCLIYELLAGTQLFAVFFTELDKPEESDEHLLDIIDALQPLPDSMMKQCSRAHNSGLDLVASGFALFKKMKMKTPTQRD